MPISSGANGWPTVYNLQKQPPKSPPGKVLMIDRGQPGPEVTQYDDHYYHNPPSNGAPPPKQQDHMTEIDRHHHSPVNDYYSKGPHGYGRYRSDGTIVHTDGRGPGRWQTGPDGKRVWVDDDEKSSGCCGRSSNYTTGVAGAGAGCCGGGMFGSRRYPFSPEHEYHMKGTGNTRCLACVIGLLIVLALLALLLGLLLGLKPKLEEDRRRTEVQNTLTGGYYQNGVYYYPITDPPDVYYLALGPGIPCNQYNNNSDIVQPTEGYELYTEYPNSTDSSLSPDSYTVTVTAIPIETDPNCNEITTSFVLAANYSPTTTTTTVSVITTQSKATIVTPGGTLAIIWFWTLCLCVGVKGVV